MNLDGIPCMRVPVGQSNFKEIISNDYVWIDKSMLIKEVLDDGAKIILLARPRRFGKTLNQSMLHYFFADEIDGIATAGLFDNTQLYKTSRDIISQHQGQYPVIFISFKDIKEISFADAYQHLSALLRDMYSQHRYLLESDKLYDDQKEIIQLILNRQATSDLIKQGLKELTYYLYCHHQKPAVILIDEYDSPIQEAYVNDYYVEMIAFMRSFLGAGLKDNNYLYKAVLTGILRISRESLFSDLNNIDVYTLLNSQYAEYFGFTENEVKWLLQQTQSDINISALSEWYNGYQIGNTIIYNPWSIVSCIKHQGKFKPYWLNTSENKLIHRLITQSSDSVKVAFEKLLQGASIEKPIIENLVFTDLDSSEQALWTLLFMSGYVKVISSEFARGSLFCQLAIPNKEVLGLFESIIEQWISGETAVAKKDNFIVALLQGDIKSFESQLTHFMLQVASSHDVRSDTQETFFHGLLLGSIIFINNENYLIKSNKESGLGRYDIVIIPKDKNRTGIIIELKSLRNKSGNEAKTSQLQKAANQALKQIDELHYIAEFKQHNIKKIIKVGIAFNGKQLMVKHAS